MEASSDFKVKYLNLIQKQLNANQKHLKSLDYPGSQISFDLNDNRIPAPDPNLRVFFFDVDNTLYKRSTHVEQLMVRSITNYLENFLGLDEEEARQMNETYYRKYGLVIKGLAVNAGVDTLQYNKMVDDSLPLQKVLKPDLKLRSLLEDLKNGGKIDKLWLFTNSYKKHAIRCVRILGIADLFDGITYCDYSKAENMLCKPDVRAFEKAKEESGLGDYSNSYFIDDSGKNVEIGSKLGMKCIHLVENSNKTTFDIKSSRNSILVSDILDMKEQLPELF